MLLNLDDLTRTQQIFLKAGIKKEYEIYLALGSVRQGKSAASAIGLVTHSLHFDSRDFIVSGKTLGSVHRNLIPYFIDVCQQFKIKYSMTRGSGTTPPCFRCGSNNFYLFGGNTEKSQDAVQGLTSYGAACDEVLLYPESFFNQVLLRHSPDAAVLFLTGNKESPQHWFKSGFVDRANEIDMYVVEVPFDENQHISDKRRQQYKQSFQGHYFKRNIANEWSVAEGIVYATVNYVQPNNKLRASLTPEIVSVDWGTTGVVAALAYRDGVIYNEYYYRGNTEPLTEDEHISRIVDKFGEPKLFIVDPSAALMKNRLRKRGFKVKNAINDILEGIQGTQDLLTNGDIVIYDDLLYFKNEISGYVWNPKTDKPVKANDHLMDCLRYLGRHLRKPVGRFATNINYRG